MTIRDPLDPFVLAQRGEAFVDGYSQAVGDAQSQIRMDGDRMAAVSLLVLMKVNAERYAARLLADPRIDTRSAGPVDAVSVNPLVAEITADLEAVDGMVDNMIVFVLRHAVAHVRRVQGVELSSMCLDTVDHVLDLIDPDAGRSC